jgi:hypothetical protein
MQERILATRNMHFTEYECVWECYGGLRCECMVLNRILRPRAVGYDSWTTLYFKSRWASIFAASRENKRNPSITALRLSYDSRQPTMYDVWYMVVQAACLAPLTVQSDKLPALSGLAQVMIHNGAGTYLAGLWSTNLQSDLIWSVNGGTGP